MAEGSNFERGSEDSISLSLESDEISDFVCTSCEARNQKAEAECYCTECEECFCVTCINFHANFKATKKHQVLGKDQVHMWGGHSQITSPVSNITEQCTMHPGKFLEMYCGQDKVLCCHVCVSLHHRICEGMVYVPDAAKGTHQSSVLQTVLNSLESLQLQTNKVKNTRQQNQLSLQQSNDNALETFKDLRKRVNIVSDALETRATIELDKVLKENIDTIKKDIDECEETEAELQQKQNELSPSNTDNECQTFINMKKCQEKIPEYKNKVEKMSKTERNDTFKFTTAPEIDNFLSNIHSLGNIEVTSSSAKAKTKQDNKTNILKNPSPRKVHKQRTLNNGHNYHVKFQSDKQDCLIMDSCVMADGSILLTDNNNKNLKHFDPSFVPLTSPLNLSYPPHGVCCMDTDTVAVTLENKSVNIIMIRSTDTGNKEFHISRSFSTNHDCKGISYFNGQLYVTHWSDTVYIYDQYGRQFRKIERDISDGNKMFSATRHLVVNPANQTLYVADRVKGLVTVKFNGHSYYYEQELFGGQGICIDDDGLVLICSWESNKIFQIDDNGETKIGEVGGKTDGINNPTSMCISRRGEKQILIVTMGHWSIPNNTIRVFELGYK